MTQLIGVHPIPYFILNEWNIMFWGKKRVTEIDERKYVN